MKKLISLFILTTMLLSSIPAFAKEGYITLEPYPYSTHILGEDLTIYGRTNIGWVRIALFPPPKEGHSVSIAKYVMNITYEDLKNGYTIPTDTIDGWPEGEWKITVNYGEICDEIKIQMTKEAVYNRYVRVAEYDSDALKMVKTYPCRGISIKNNVFSFTTEDNTLIKIFSWNNLAPTNKNESRIYVAEYVDNCLTDIKTYPGTISRYSNHISLDMGNAKFKLFYWNEALSPIKQ